MKLTITEYGVLGLLAEGEKSGYDLHKSAERSIGYIWRPAKSQIYKVLPRLVRLGCATRREVEQSGRPDKQLYRITRAGKGALREWLETIDRTPEANREALLLKVYFGSFTRPEVMIAHVEAYRRDVAETVAVFEEIDGRIKGDQREFFPYLTLKHGLARSRATVAWADESLRVLRARQRRRADRAR